MKFDRPRFNGLPSQIVILREKKQIVCMRLLLSRADCDSKETIFLYRFYIKKGNKKRKFRPNERVYIIRMLSRHFTNKKARATSDNTSNNSWFMVRSYTPSNFRDTLNFYNILKSITAFRFSRENDSHSTLSVNLLWSFPSRIYPSTSKHAGIHFTLYSLQRNPFYFISAELLS